MAEGFQLLLEASSMNLSTMGRGIKEEPDFFMALGAAARVAERVLRGEQLSPIRLA